MKRFLPVVLSGLLALSLGLSGCELSPSYSSLVQYGKRTDPLMVATQPGDLGEDQYDPDRPGVFPIMHPKDVLQPDDPLSVKGMELFKQAKLRDPNELPAAERQQLEQALIDVFGTPADPKVAEISPEDRAKLQLDEPTLKEGSRHYRIHCVHCHGVPGDGRGPTARWISPHPRDFRQGLFKFMSVDQTKGQVDLPPRRDDLLHTLRQGIEGTAMPSFVLLNATELNQLVSYVIHLSMRGKAEFETIARSFEWKYADGNFTVKFTADEDTPTVAAALKDWHKRNADKWVASQDPKNAIQVKPYDEKDPKSGEWQVWKTYEKDEADKARVRGAIAVALFNNEEPRIAEAREILKLRGDKPANVNCKQCHADYGRQAKFKFDSWATLVRPNNFTNGVFRGGRRPVDIYHRIHSGINGSNMTPFGTPGTMTSNSIWNMVEFVQSLSYPAMRSKMGVEID